MSCQLWGVARWRGGCGEEGLGRPGEAGGWRGCSAWGGGFGQGSARGVRSVEEGPGGAQTPSVLAEGKNSLCRRCGRRRQERSQPGSGPAW